MTTRDSEIEKLHEEACRQGDLTYRDPVTGFAVMTRIAHLARGYCCTSGCRHCPYKNNTTSKEDSDEDR